MEDVMSQGLAANETTEGLDSTVEHTIAPGEGTADDSLQLTEREIAIAEGRDPDAQVTTLDEEVEDSIEKDTSTEGIQQHEEARVAEGKDAHSSEEEDWRDDEAKAIAASYGIPTAELADYETREDFDRLIGALDRRLSIKPAEQHEPPLTNTPPPHPQQRTTQQQEVDKAAEFLNLDQFNEFDDETKTLAGAVRNSQEENAKLRQQLGRVVNYLVESRNQSMREQQQQVEALEEQRRREFHELVDTMDEERYGRQFDENGHKLSLPRAADENRRRLLERALQMRSNLESLARQEDREFVNLPRNILLKRAEQYEFADDIRLAEQRSYQERLAAQSKRRRPSPGRQAGGSRKSAKPEGPKPGSAEAIAADPDVMKLWNTYQEENGVQ